MVGIAALCGGLWFVSKLRYWTICFLALIPFQVRWWSVRFFGWLSVPGNRTTRVLATFTIVLFSVALINVVVMIIGVSNLGHFLTTERDMLSTMWKDSIPAILRDCQIKGNINTQGDRIYHTQGSPYYHDTIIKTAEGERWFCSIQEAEDSGWRAPYPAP